VSQDSVAIWHGAIRGSVPTFDLLEILQHLRVTTSFQTGYLGLPLHFRAGFRWNGIDLRMPAVFGDPDFISWGRIFPSQAVTIVLGSRRQICLAYRLNETLSSWKVATDR